MVTQTSTGTLRRICAWCECEGVETVLHEGEMAAVNGVLRPSYGICSMHREHLLREWAESHQTVCPFCGHVDLYRRFARFVKPPEQEAAFNTVLRCPECGQVYSPQGCGRVGGSRNAIDEVLRDGE